MQVRTNKHMSCHNTWKVSQDRSFNCQEVIENTIKVLLLTSEDSYSISFKKLTMGAKRRPKQNNLSDLKCTPVNLRQNCVAIGTQKLGRHLM